MDPGRELEGAEHGHDEGPAVVDTYRELCVPELLEIACEQLRERRTGRERRPTGVELEILASLWSHGFLFANQIWRRWWPDRTRRWAYHALKQMTLAGWLDRYRLVVAGGGAQQRFYGLAEPGFELARGRRLRGRKGIPHDARWRRSIVDRTEGLPRELHVNGWVLAMEQLTGELMSGWRGQFENKLLPPRRRAAWEWVAVRPADIDLGTNHRLTGHQANVLEPVHPHATIELQLPYGRRVELMVEYQQDDDPLDATERLQHYDLFVSGWAHLLDRYRGPGRTPIVVFVCPDERTLAGIAGCADGALTTRIAKAGTPDQDWPFPGRQSILFALESEIHQGSLDAFALAEHPTHQRGTTGAGGVKLEELGQCQIIDPRLLPAPAPAVATRPSRSRIPTRSARTKP